MRAGGAPLHGGNDGEVSLSRISFVEMINVAGFLDHVASGVIEVGVEFGFLHHAKRLLLQEFDLFGDDRQFAPRHRARALVRFLYLHGQSDEVVVIRIFVRSLRVDELNSQRSGVGFDERHLTYVTRTFVRFHDIETPDADDKMRMRMMRMQFRLKRGKFCFVYLFFFFFFYIYALCHVDVVDDGLIFFF